MDFKPVDKTIRDLLKSGHQFEIPRFQRAYSWERRNKSNKGQCIYNSQYCADDAVSDEDSLTHHPSNPSNPCS